MKEHLNEFLEYLKFEKGLSENTLEAYGRDLSKFLAYLQQRKIETPGDVKRSDILAFISHLLDEGAAFSSSARHLSSIKSFFRFLILEGHITINPADNLESPKIRRKLPEVLTVEEIERLMASPNVVSPTGLRDRAMFELMYAAGLRVSELLALEWTISTLPRLCPLYGEGAQGTDCTGGQDCQFLGGTLPGTFPAKTCQGYL